MRLAEYTDYTLRVLMYCAARPGQLVTIGNWPSTTALSKNHLMKIVNDLARQGVIATTRGRGGGLRLLKDPADIRVGDVVRRFRDRFPDGGMFRFRHQCLFADAVVSPEGRVSGRIAGVLQGTGSRHAGRPDRAHAGGSRSGCPITARPGACADQRPGLPPPYTRQARCLGQTRCTCRRGSPATRRRECLQPAIVVSRRAHSHSIVNRRVRLMGRSGALARRSERDTDIRTVAFVAIVEVRSRRSRSACPDVRSAWDRLGSKLTTVTVSVGLFCDVVTVFAGPMTVSRFRLPAPRKGRARVSGNRLRAGGARPARRRWSCLRSRTAPGSQIVRKE
jgi:Rrf2 family protein